MSAEAVDEAVERVRSRDIELGQHAEAAAGGLTAGEGTKMLSQAGVQEWVWWHLPRKFPREVWGEVAQAAALLLDELGFNRYAEIVRSDVTDQVLAAWRTGSAAGTKRTFAALRASGVEPPDTDLIQWGEIFGADEAAARDTVERALEDAIVSGRFSPGGRNWRRRAAEVCDEVMSSPSERLLGLTPMAQVITERVESWINAAREDAYRTWCKRIANQLLAPAPPPEAAERVVGPLRWLLVQAVEGTKLTQSGYLPPRLVKQAVERFGWWDWEKPPRSEADVPQLYLLRDTATRLRLLKRRGRTVTATARGQQLAGDTAALWDELVTTLGASDDFDLVVAELMALRLLLEGPARGAYDRLVQDVLPVLVEQGWRTSEGPVDAHGASRAVHHHLFWWRVLGLLEEERPTWDPATRSRAGEYVVGLSPAGEAAALAYLRHRATRPRRSIHEL